MKVAVVFLTAMLAVSSAGNLEGIMMKNLLAVNDDLMEINRLFSKDQREKRALEYTGDSATCSFERNTCQFKQDTPGKNFDWAVKKANEIQKKIYDNRETQGSMMVAQILANHNRNEFAELTETFTLQSTKQCVSFRYFMFSGKGCDVARMTVSVECGNANEQVLLKESRSSFEKKWIFVQREVTGAVNDQCTIKFRAAKGLGHGRAAIDDLEIHKYACPEGDSLLPAVLECNFQMSFCEWKSSGDAELTIGRNTPSGSTGPDRAIDRTGNFAFIESSIYPNKQAVLTAPSVFSGQDTCMRILINMYGDKEKFGGIQITNNNQDVVNEKGDKGKNWFEKWIDLPKNQVNQLIIKITGGGNDLGDLAIDDIIVENGKCQDIYELAKCDFSNNATCGIKANYGCTETTEDVQINGVATKALSLSRNASVNCDNKDYKFDFKIPSSVRTPRMACVHFDYLYQSQIDEEYDVCDIYVKQLNNGFNRQLKHMKIGYEGLTWQTSKVQIFEKMEPNDNSKIEFRTRIKAQCPAIKFANFRLTSGPC